MLKPYLFIDKTKDKGRGVFTRERIPANTNIETAPDPLRAVARRKRAVRSTLLSAGAFRGATAVPGGVGMVRGDASAGR